MRKILFHGAALLLPTAAALKEPAVWDGIEIDPFPDGLTIHDNIITLTVSSVVVGLFVVAVVVHGLYTGKARLPLIILSAVLVAVMAVGICTWVITYSPARDAIEAQTNSLLIFAGLAVSRNATADLRAGSNMALGLWREIIQGGLDLDRGYPEVHKSMLRHIQSLGQLSGTFAAVYIGTEAGYFHSIFPIGGDQISLGVGTAAKLCESADYSGYGTAGSSCLADDVELRCESNSDVWGTCRHRACSSSDGSCAFCLTDLGTVVNSSDRCPGCTPCEAFIPVTLDSFTVSNNISDWDLPPTAGRQPGICFEAGAEQLRGVDDVVYLQGYFPNGTAGRRWGGSRRLAARGSCSDAYDPRVRLWYHRRDGLHWSAVYQYSISGDVFEAGVTAIVAVRNNEYSGAPYTAGVPPNLDDDPWAAVIGVDFSFTSISAFLPSLLPTPNSAVLIADLEGTLIAGSLHPGEMSVKSVNQDGTSTYNTINVTTPGGWKRRDLHHVFLSIIRWFGSLRMAMRTRAIIQGDGAVVLSQPLQIEGGLEWAMAINVPYSDVTEDSEKATTLALVLAVVISMSSGLVVSALVFLMLRPLVALAQHMHSVARMQLEDLGNLHGGCTAEVTMMVDDFGVMVAALKQYRSYLPQAVLNPVDDTSSSDPGDSRVATGPPRSSTSSPRSPAGQIVPSRQSSMMDTGVSHHSSSCSSSVVSYHSGGGTNTGRKEGRRGTALGPTLGIAELRTVTTMAGSVRMLHRSIGPKLRPLGESLQALVGALQQAVGATKGCVEGVVGDRSRCSWNAVRHVGGHRARGAFAAATLCLRSAEPVLSLAVCCGEAVCGHFGDQALRYPAIIGPVCSFVNVLERYIACVGRPRVSVALCEQNVRRDQPLVHFRWHSRVTYAKASGRPVIVWEVTGLAKEQEGLEWMYAMAETEACAPFKEYNAAAEAAVRGDPDKARALLQDIPPESQQQPYAAELLRKLAAGTFPGPPLQLSDVGIGSAADMPPPGGMVAITAEDCISELSPMTEHQPATALLGDCAALSSHSSP